MYTLEVHGSNVGWGTNYPNWDDDDDDDDDNNNNNSIY